MHLKEHIFKIVILVNTKDIHSQIYHETFMYNRQIPLSTCCLRWLRTDYM